MNGNAPIATLRIGLIGSGFINNFHLQALVSVRHVSVTGVYSTDRRQSRGAGGQGQRARARALPGRSLRSKPC